MKRLFFFIIPIVIFISCQDPWATYPYTTFDQALEEISNEYGEPALIKDTVFYDDGTVRNRMVYWDIDPPEPYTVTVGSGESSYTSTRYYTTVSAEVWHQPYGDKSSLVRHRQYGWEILRWNKGTYQYIE